ncbi:DUF222 domain-containing protein [Actinopolymorpha sp. B17G11]|uniref:DUF222 domain-containing protein n=1 Tax=Actinopolymorpha sp. B17G11 TaxID=3160861 RepID=UPI0032E43200
MFDRRGDPDFSVLASAAPGAELGAVLAGIDTAAVNGHVRVLVMAAWERQVSWASARLYEVMAHVARSPACEPDSPPELDRCFGEFASAEVGAALCMSPGSADRELSFAFELTERLPLTRAALTAGRISVGKARSIADETSWLAPELAGVAEAFILAADAGASGLTRAQLVRRLRRKVCELDPDGVEARRKEAQQGRRVRFGAGVYGTGTIEGRDLPLAGTAAARVFIKAAAKRIRAGGDVRTLAQIEADVYLDLLRGRHPATAERDDDTATPTGSDIPAQGEGPPATGNAAPSTSGGDEAADPTAIHLCVTTLPRAATLAVQVAGAGWVAIPRWTWMIRVTAGIVSRPVMSSWSAGSNSSPTCRPGSDWNHVRENSPGSARSPPR